MRCAVLDLGSNSFHLLVADVDANTVIPVRRHREMLHLGRSIAQHGTIPVDLIIRAIATVERLADLARSAGAQQIVAVGTEALRGESRAGVVAQLSAAAGTAVEILSGTEEARLAYFGARASVDVIDDPTLVIDLGGGSLELAIGSRDRVLWGISLPLGASRLTAMLDTASHALDGPSPLNSESLARLRHHISFTLEDATAAVRSHDPATTIAVGGVVRALGRYLAERNGRWLPATVNQAPLRTDEITRAAAELTGLDTAGRAQLPGIKSRRADHLHVGALVLEATLTGIGGPVARVSDWGLREGLLLHRFGQVRIPTGPDLRMSQVAWLRATFDKEVLHSDHVARTALRLFDSTAALHGHDARARELLGHAARLHGIGKALTLRRQHEHGAYLLEHAELRGFDPEELALLLTLIRFHPSRGISRRYGPFAALPQEARERAADLLALLQIADALDTSHDQQLELITARRSRGGMELQLNTSPVGLTERTVRGRSQLFVERFGLELKLASRSST